jgi:DNA-damage-inducible protein D
MENDLSQTIKKLDDAKQLTKNGGEYWLAREIQSILGYATWENFHNVINKARMACESSGIEPDNQFRSTTKKVAVGSGAMVPQVDYFLTRYACYLIAMNGDASTKPEIATAQTYFAVQTRRQEIQDKLTTDEKRLQLRDRVKNANKDLNSAAKDAGVQRYALFHDAGYRGLYEMGLSDIKRKKGLLDKEDLLDRASRAELAANEFRITQTEVKLVRDKINNEKDAVATHREVGREVRATIKKLNGVMPEELPAEASIKKLVQASKNKTKQIS